MKRTYHHLSPIERATLMLMQDQGYSLRAIGTKLRRVPSTLSRENHGYACMKLRQVNQELRLPHGSLPRNHLTA
jgi:hypothetical protein